METCLTPTSVSQTNNFGLLYSVGSPAITGRIYAQPLAYGQVPINGCTQPNCPNVVYVADEQDNLYAFNPANQQPVWSVADPVNLAGSLTLGGNSGQYVNCTTINKYNPNNFPACGTDSQTEENSPFVSFGIGVTGTPVIDPNPINGPTNPVLYAVAAICFDSATPCGSSQSSTPVAGYYLFAVDITTGKILAATPPQSNGLGISGSVPGNPPKLCSWSSGGNGITFNNAHLQRSALLLTPNNHTVYVAFADFPEINNGWLFGYQLQNQSGGGFPYSFSQTAAWATTPWGTGGGIWGAGAGPAADASGNIYLATGNGTIYPLANPQTTPPTNLGDTLLELAPSGNTFSVRSWYTPSNVLSFQGTINGSACTGLCKCDEDVSSGGVLLPTGFTYNGNSVVINADKQSNIYVADQNNLGGYNAAGGNNVETVLTPCVVSNGPNGGGSCTPEPASQGYWSSPAYWSDGTNHWLYYSADMNSGGLLCNGSPCTNGFGPPGVSPEPLNAYLLQPTGATGPITQGANANSGTSNGPPNGQYPVQFCDFAPTPSVSSTGNTAGSGIVWATEENQNNDNRLGPNQSYHDCAMAGANGKGTGGNPKNNPGALHAFCAEAGGTACPLGMTELYSSRGISQANQPGPVHGFPTPTVFNGQVFMGTDSGLWVFGICPPPPGKCLQ